MGDRLDYNNYTVAWIGVLPIEAEAALGVLDKRHEGRFESLSSDDYIYIGGEINNHNVVIATWPAGQNYGPSSAAALANQVKARFPRLWISLLVGVAAGLPNLTPKDPSKYRDIRLGDILVSVPDQGNTGIFQYDLGKATAEGFLRNGRQAETAAIVRSAIKNIQLTKERPFKKGNQFATWLADFQASSQNDKFSCPSQEQDRLCESHPEKGPALQPVLIKRQPRDESERTLVWYGTIGSGSTLMKDAAQRDQLRDEHDIIGLEMEAAGIMNTLAPGVIRGVCDYGDAQKSKDWQPYAAAVAAVYAKGILYTITPKIDSVHNIIPSADVCFREYTPLWLVPFESKDKFVGRASQLDRLTKLLFPGDRYGKVAITGLGGVGKSRMALEMAYRTKKQRPSCSVFWIQATDSSSFERDCRQIGQELNIAQINDSKEDAKLLLKQHFNSERTNEWLLIIDNADDVDLWTSRTVSDGRSTTPLMNYVPRSSSGAILLTTRNHQVAVRIAQKNIVPLQELNENDALTMMKDQLIHPEILDENPSTTSLLLEHLAFLPLAIVQVAAYLNENQIQDINAYLRLWDSTEEATVELLSEEFEDEYRDREARKPVAATWLISFEQVRKQNSLSADLLAFLACLDFKAIPESLFPFAMFGTGFKDNRMTKAIAVLTGYAFLRIQESSKHDPLYDMHRLVHLATRNWLRQQDSLAGWVRKVALHLDDCFPTADIMSKRILGRYLPHAEKVCSSPEIEDDEGRFELLRTLGYCYCEDGKYGKAVDALQKVVSWRTERFAPEDVKSLEACSELGESLVLLGSYHEAEICNQRAVDGLTGVLGIEHATTVRSVARLAKTYFARGKLEKAEELQEQVVAIRKRTLGEEHGMTLDSVNHLALSYRARGRLDKAAKIQEAAMEAARRIFGEQHRSMTSYMHNLATTYLNKGRLKDAEELLSGVLRIRRNAFGEQHPSTLQTMGTLASVYREQGRLKDAEEMELVVLEVRRKIFGDEHRDTLVGLNNLSETYRRQGRLEEAKDLQLELLATSKRTLGEDHPDTLTFMSSLADTCEELGCLERAVDLSEECLRFLRQVLGDGHPETLKTMHNLALRWDKTGRLEEAVALMDECVEIERQKYGDDVDPDRVLSMECLGILLHKAGRQEEAITLMEECLKISGETLGEDHARTIGAREWLAEWMGEDNGENHEENHEEREAISDNIISKVQQEEAVSKPSDDSSSRMRFKHAFAGDLRATLSARKKT
ncbi:uncharacterized protein PV07_11010 [Cladophialophora immunda]|uniref:NB-ARC domain-containing protein n=1 Tax=Cladophialophora immunda TaxID=569365 RepID=A0A0D2CGQ5_9EURO|nr:uncharacterized protein PV07_11010 [Cladophialophora immunda]KIW22744.1 hypothetical protein PV07_11010 [Cladophialophora immunda]OQU94040.1 NB-ARC domain-containing protein [Cladophialophora immunda]